VNTANLIGRLGKFNVISRKDCFTSHAGMLLVKEFADHLGVTDLINKELKVKQRLRGYSDAEAVLGLVYNTVVGGDCLLDLEVLRGDPGTRELIGLQDVIAPTSAGEHLRKFDIGDIHDLQRVNHLLQQQVRPMQQSEVCTLDLDSSVYEQASTKKEGSTKAYNGEVGYHPLMAFWDETGELVMSHLRRGSAYTASKVLWFLDQTIKRVPAESTKKMRADSGFYSWDVVRWCEANCVEFAITADQTAPLMEAIEAIEESQWEDLERYGVAQVAELRYQPVRWEKEYRYVVKRELMVNKKGELYFRYHVHVTNNEGLEAWQELEWHLAHANMENRIKEHKSGFGLEKLPTRKFHANWAYLLIGQIAYNLIAWMKRLILPESYHQVTIKTIRHHLLNLAGKIVRSGRRWYLIISDEYRYKEVWEHAIEKLSALGFA
jgi:hypothetical protein